MLKTELIINFKIEIMGIYIKDDNKFLDSRELLEYLNEKYKERYSVNNLSVPEEDQFLCMDEPIISKPISDLGLIDERYRCSKCGGSTKYIVSSRFLRMCNCRLGK